MKERSGVTFGRHAFERAGDRSNGISLDGATHEHNDGDHVVVLDAPPEDRFGDAVLAHHEQVARFAFTLTGNRDIAEASVTEAYARLWPRFRRGRMPDLLPHLIREVITEVKERSRQDRKRTTAPTESDDVETPWIALHQLPLEQRSAVVLHVVEGVDLEESAQLLGETVDLTATRVDVGMDRIAKLLVAGGMDA